MKTVRIRETPRARLALSSVVAALAIVVMIGCALPNGSSKKSGAAGTGSLKVSFHVPDYRHYQAGAKAISPSTYWVKLYLTPQYGTATYFGKMYWATSEVTALTTYTFTNIPAGTYDALRLDLCDPDGVVLTSGTATSEYVSNRAGSRAQQGIGITFMDGYTTVVQVNCIPVVASANVLDQNASVSGLFTASYGMTFYQVPVTSTSQSCTVTITPSMGSPDVYVFNSYGAPMATYQKNVDYFYTRDAVYSLTFTPNVLGYYYIGVYGYQSETYYTLDVTGPINLTMVPITGGNFNMYNSGLVSLSDFSMSAYEITQAQYRAVMGTNPSYFSNNPTHPVERVSWSDAVTFCNLLSTREGLSQVYTFDGSTWTADLSKDGYRLPTEAEWEYAARGGTSYDYGYYYSGSNSLDAVGWYYNNSGNITHPVGSLTANQFGLFDMSGNVWEWCQDWYGTLPTVAQVDPTGSGSGTYRILKGGAWNDGGGGCAVAGRTQEPPAFSDSVYGFRVVRSTPMRLASVYDIGETQDSNWYASDGYYNTVYPTTEGGYGWRLAGTGSSYCEILMPVSLTATSAKIVWQSINNAKSTSLDLLVDGITYATYANEFTPAGTKYEITVPLNSSQILTIRFQDNINTDPNNTFMGQFLWVYQQ